MEKFHKRKFIKAVRIVLFSLAGMFLLVLGASACFYNFVLTPEKLTSIVKQVADDTVDADIELGNVYLTVFASFPRLVVAVDSSWIMSRNNKIDSSRIEARRKFFAGRRDTSRMRMRNLDGRKMLGFSKAYIDINPFEYLFNNKIKADRISLIEPEIYFTIYADSSTNFDIVINGDTGISGEAVEIPQIDVKQLSVKKGRVRFSDLTSQTSFSLRNLDVDLSVKNVSKEALLRGKASVSGYSLELFGYRFERNRNLKVNLDGRYDKREKIFYLAESVIDINGLNINAEGNMRSAGYGKSNVDVEFILASPTVDKLLALVPRGMLDKNIKITGDGQIDVKGKLHGLYGDGEYPVFTSKICINNVRACYGNMPAGIDRLDAEADMVIDMNKGGCSFVHLDNFVLDAGDGSVHMTAAGAVENFIDEPRVMADIVGNIDFARLNGIIPVNDSIFLAGNGKFDIKAKFDLQDILDGKYNLVRLEGGLLCNNIDFIRYSDPIGRDSTDMVNVITLDSVVISMDNGAAGSKSVLTADMGKSFISLEKKYSEIRADGVKASLSGMNTKKGIYENMHVDIQSRNLRYRDRDRKYFKLVTAAIMGTGSSNADTPVPNLSMQIDAGGLFFAIPDTLYASGQSAKFKTDIKPQPDSRKRAAIDADGTLEGLKVKSHVTGTDLSLENVAFTASLITPRKGTNMWTYEGVGSIVGMNARTGLFPLNARIPRSYFTFNTRYVQLTRTSLYLGKSDFILSGKIKGLLGRMFFERGVIDGSVYVSSKNLDLNEIMAAAGNVSEEELLNDSLPSSMIVIPDYLNMELRTNLRNISLFNMVLDNVDGTVSVKKKGALLNPVQIKTVGATIDLFAKYTAQDSAKAEVGMEAKIRNIGLDKLAVIFPSLRTMMPMVTSMKGNINLDMVASGNLYGDYEFDMNTFNAVMRLRGTDLVLMDGDTFAKISKILMFKNKKENLVPKLNMDVIAGGGKAVIKPAKVNIDRYELIAGGTQWFDMRCDYNVSVIKSPLPFKAGVDITNKDDELKIGVGRASLKKTDFRKVEKEVEASYNGLLNSVKN